MLLPFEYAILTVDEARLLVKFIQTQTSIKKDPSFKNYKKMQELGVMEIFQNLEGFIMSRNQHEELQNLNVRNVKMED